MHKTLIFIRDNAIALAALFVALGGTSYAALTINGSQIRNRTIDAIKLNPQTISASIRSWAIVYAGTNTASASASSSRVRVSVTGTGELITWSRRRFARNCMVSATPHITVSSGPYSSVSAQFDPSHGSVLLYGFGPDKPGRPASAYVMIVCP